MKFGKLDLMEVDSLTQHCCFLIKEALSRMPGRKGSPEQAEARLIGSMGVVIASAMQRRGLGSPSENIVVSSSLSRRLFDAVEDWERQHAGKQ